jgi:hypothetical protein
VKAFELTKPPESYKTFLDAEDAIDVLECNNFGFNKSKEILSYN